jgi:hypothetical protein
MAQRSNTRSPERLRLSSTNFTLEELTSMPNKGAGSRLNNDPNEIKAAPKMLAICIARLKNSLEC